MREFLASMTSKGNRKVGQHMVVQGFGFLGLCIAIVNCPDKSPELFSTWAWFSAGAFGLIAGANAVAEHIMPKKEG